jgi:hypothetical protein
MTPGEPAMSVGGDLPEIFACQILVTLINFRLGDQVGFSSSVGGMGGI